MKSAALAASVLSFAGLVLAQTNTTTVNPSASCTTFLTGLNTNQAIGTCLNSLIGATSDFDPSNTAHTNATSSAAAITAALDKICLASFTACDESAIRGTLADFFTQCQSDLLGTNGDGTNGIKGVIDTYDVLYLLVPLKNAICSRDQDGKFCVNKMSTGTSSSSSRSSSSGSASASASAASTSAHAKRYIEPYKRDLVTVIARAAGDGNNTQQLTLGGLGNQSAQMSQDGLPYLFMTPQTTDAELCTNCTAQVVGAYIAFENVTPYALGLPRSPILSGQLALWQRLKTCNGGQLVRNILNDHVGSPTQYNSGFVGASVNAWLAASGAAFLFGAAALF